MPNTQTTILNIVLLLITVTLTALLPGCGNNGTMSLNFTYNSPAIRVCVAVTIPGANGTFPPGLTWSDPPGAPTIHSSVGGPNDFELCWDYAGGTKFSVSVSGNAPGRPTITGVRVRTETGHWVNIPRGRLNTNFPVANTVQFSNPPDNPDTLFVSHVQWALTQEPIAEDQLFNGDPVIESLPWQDLTGPFTLAPGESVLHHLPVDGIPPDYTLVTRYVVYDQSEDTPLTVYGLTDNSAHPDLPGDLNGDGVVDVSDLLILFNHWGECEDCDDCPADLNGDCAVNVSDLLILFSHWG